MKKRITALLIALMLMTSAACAEGLFSLSGLFGSKSDGLALTNTHLYGDFFAIQYPASWSVGPDSSSDTEDYRYGSLLYSPEDTGFNGGGDLCGTACLCSVADDTGVYGNRIDDRVRDFAELSTVEVRDSRRRSTARTDNAAVRAERTDAAL